MSEEVNNQSESQEAERPRFQARIPGFVGDEEIGLGDVLKHATSAMGIKPCGGCEHRAAILNRWMVFTGRGSG